MSTSKPKAPRHLTAAAKRKWRELLPTLPNTEAATLDLLTSYAAAWDRMVEAEKKVGELGVVVRGSGGSASVSPYLTVAQQERRALRQLADALGLSAKHRKAAAPRGAAPALLRLTQHRRAGG